MKVIRFLIKFFKWGLAFIMAIGAFIGIIEGLKDLLHEKELTITTARIEDLTRLTRYPGLVADFSYMGVPVKRMWLIELKIQNTGTETIIGRGAFPSLINDSIIFGYERDYKIIDKRWEINDPDASIKTNEGSFEVEFDQWRPGENIIITQLVYSDEEKAKEPKIRPLNKRAIIDGDIKCIDKTKELSNTYKGVPLAHWPIWIRVTLNIFSALLNMLGVILSSLLFIVALTQIGVVISYGRWKKDNADLLITHLRDKGGINIDPTRLEYIMKDPSKRIPENLWDGFEGKRPPGKPIFSESILGGIFWVVSFFFLTIVFSYTAYSAILCCWR